MITIDDPLANGQSQPCATVLVVGVEALEQSKDFLPVMGRDANPVVTDAEFPAHVAPFSRYMNDGWLLGTVVLDAVPDQVLQDLLQVGIVHAYAGEGVAGNSRVVVADGPGEISEDHIECFV